MRRHHKAILGGVIAGLGLGTALALILNIALTQLTINWATPTPFPNSVLATFISVAAGVVVGLGAGLMVAALTREDAVTPSS